MTRRWDTMHQKPKSWSEAYWFRSIRFARDRQRIKRDINRMFGRFHSGGPCEVQHAAVDDQVFAFRDSPTGNLKFVLAPGETVDVGTMVALDRESGKVRRARGDDLQKFTVPPGSRTTSDGYLEMPT